MSTFNVDVSVNVYSESQSVDITNFGRIAFLTEDVEVGFTELYRLYESNNAARADSDLSATAKLAAAAFFSQELRPRDLMIASVTYTTFATDLAALVALVGGTANDFYGIATQDRTKANLNDLADWIAANGKVGIIQSSDTDITAGTALNLFETLNGDSNDRVAGIWHDDDAEYADLAWLATILSCDLDSQSSVAHDKELVGCTAPGSSDIDDTKKGVVLGYNGNLYLPFFGDPVMRPGTMFGGAWIEDTIQADWLKARLQEAFARLVKKESAANSKVPYDDFGIAQCESEIRAVIDKGIQIGHFVADSLTLDVPKLADISAATRATKAVTISGNVLRTGAIKDLNFSVTISF